MREKYESWVYDDDGDLKVINCQCFRDSLGNEKKVYKHGSGESTLGLVIIAILAVLVGVGFWEALWAELGV